MGDASRSFGFSTVAFDPFFTLLHKRDMQGTNIPESFSGLLGISVNHDRSSWVQVAALTPGHAYGEKNFTDVSRQRAWQRSLTRPCSVKD